MKVKIITLVLIIFTLITSVASAKNKQTSQQLDKKVAAPAKQGKQYIHKPDSTMYHPSKTKAALKDGGYRHAPDSTKVGQFPQRPTTKSPKKEGGYRHAPDSTKVGQFPQRPTTKAPKAGKGYRHKDDSTMVRPQMPEAPSKK